MDYKPIKMDIKEELTMDAAAYIQRGIEKWSTGNINDGDDAIDDFLKAIEIDPNHEWSYNNRELIHSLWVFEYHGGMNDMESCTKAIETNPEYASAYFSHGMAKRSLGDYQGAIDDFTKTIEIDPNYALAYFYRGSAKSLFLFDYHGAKEDFTKAIEINPNDMWSYLNSFDCQGAIENYYTKAIEINPQDAKALFCRGKEKSKNGDKESAISDFAKSIEIEPDNHFVYYWRAMTKSSLKDYSGAIEDFSKSIEKCIDNPDADYYCSRGFTKTKINDDEGAIQDYLKAIDISPDYHLPYAWLGKIYCKRKEHFKAAEYLEKVAEYLNYREEWFTESWEDGYIRQDYSDEEWNELLKYKTNKINT